MVCAFYILFWPDSETEYPYSELLLNRRYRNSLPDDEVLIRNFELAFKKLKPEEKVPFIESNGVNYTFVRGKYDIIMMAVSVRNINAMSTIVFLNHFYAILCHYLCTEIKTGESSYTSKTQSSKPPAPKRPKEYHVLDRDRVIDNLMLIFDLIDECMDFGVVQVTDYNILKEYIKVEVNLPKLKYETDKYGSESDSDDEDYYGKKKKKDRGHGRSASTDVKSTHNQANIQDVIQDDHTLVNSSILRTYSSAINWRPKGIFYAKNEIYIDIIESCDFCYDLDSEKIKKNDIHGICVVKCYLSGMPNCKVGFNEKYISSIDNDGFREESAELVEGETSEIAGNQLIIEKDDDEDEKEEESLVDTASANSKNDVDSIKKLNRIPIKNIQFHQCVQLGSIYNDNLVTFTPPDDKFILMAYNVEQRKQSRKTPIIMIKPTYRILKQSKKLQILCTLTTKFRKRLHCKNLGIKIPLDPHLFDISQNGEGSLKYKTEMGDVSYKIDSSELLWTIDDVTGKKTVKLMAELSLSSTDHIDAALIRDSLHNRVEPTYEGDESDEDSIRKELDTFYGVNGQSTSSAKTIVNSIKNQVFHDIKITFSIPMLSHSGLKLTYLRVEEEKMKYTCFPWVRYVTESKDVQSQTNQLNTASKLQDNIYKFKLGIKSFSIIES